MHNHLSTIEHSSASADLSDTARSQREHAVLSRRAQALAHRVSEANPTEQRTPLLVVSSADQTFGLPLSDIEMVDALRQCTPAPKAFTEVVGVVSIGGAFRSVVDLGAMLQIAQPSNDAGGYIVFLNISRDKIGLRVDALKGVDHVNLTTLACLEAQSDTPWVQYTVGMTDDGVNVIDIDKLLTHPVLQNAEAQDSNFPEL